MADKKLTDESPMPMGQHKGTKMANVPAHYLLWIAEQRWCRNDIKVYVIENKDALNAENSINNKKNFDHKHYFGK